MFNPNSNSQMMESVASDLEYLGMIVADVREFPDWTAFQVGNESITFATVTFIDGKCGVRACGKTTIIRYKGSLEQLSLDVIAKVTKAALVQRFRFDPNTSRNDGQDNVTCPGAPVYR